MEYKKGEKLFKRIMIGFAAMVVVLVIHIFWVTRTRAPNPDKIVMARIDIKNPLNDEDAGKIQTWLYQQKGVNHVLVNPKSQIAVFTYHPAIVSGDQIVQNFQTSFHYDAKRFVPTEEELKNGCPVLPPTITERISAFVKNTF